MSEEPEMMNVDGVDIVKPSVRYEVGRYIKLGPSAGIVFPGLVFGPKGRALREEFKRFLSRFTDYQNEVAKDPTNTDLAAEIFDKINDAVMPLLTEALKINYNAATTEWILNNLPVQMSTISEIMDIMRGEAPPAEKAGSFR